MKSRVNEFLENKVNFDQVLDKLENFGRLLQPRLNALTLTDQW